MAAEGNRGGGGGRGRAPVLGGVRNVSYYAKMQVLEAKIGKGQRSLEDLKYLYDHLLEEQAELESENKSILITIDPSKHAEYIALAKKDLVIEESTVPPPRDSDDIRFDPKAMDLIASLAIVETKMVPLQKSIFHLKDLITFMTDRLKNLEEEVSLEHALERQHTYLGTR